MVVELELSVFINDEKVKEFRFVFVGLDSNTVADILTNEFNFSVEWLNGIDFDVWKKTDNVLFDGMVFGSVDCDDCVWIMNADEWTFKAIVKQILMECG